MVDIIQPCTRPHTSFYQCTQGNQSIRYINGCRFRCLDFRTLGRSAVVDLSDIQKWFADLQPTLLKGEKQVFSGLLTHLVYEYNLAVHTK